MAISAYPVAGQSSSVYTLTAPVGGLHAVFNDPDDGAYVGGLEGEDAITGLDGAETAPNSISLVEADGSVATPTYLPKRPIVMKGWIKSGTVAGRNEYENRLRQTIHECRRAPGTLAWEPDGGIDGGVQVDVLLNERFQVTGGWVKKFTLSLVANDPLIVSQNLNTLTDTDATPQVVPVNQGSAPAIPELIRVTGPATNARIRITNSAYGYDESVRLQGLALGGGSYMDLFPRYGTVVSAGGTNLYEYVDYPTYYTFPVLYPGSNNVTVSGTSFTSATAVRIDWRDSWE